MLTTNGDINEKTICLYGFSRNWLSRDISFSPPIAAPLSVKNLGDPIFTGHHSRLENMNPEDEAKSYPPGKTIIQCFFFSNLHFDPFDRKFVSGTMNDLRQ